MTSQRTQAADPMRRRPAAALAGRVALVTGGSGGIGQALVRRLAAEGAAVAVAYSTHADAAEQTAAQAAEAGARAVAVGADLRQPQAPAELVDAVERALGPVDVLVANAGSGRAMPSEAVSSADFDDATASTFERRSCSRSERCPACRSGALGGYCSSPRSRCLPAA